MDTAMNLNCAGWLVVQDIITTFKMVGANESRRTMWRLQSMVITSKSSG